MFKFANSESLVEISMQSSWLYIQILDKMKYKNYQQLMSEQNEKATFSN